MKNLRMVVSWIIQIGTYVTSIFFLVQELYYRPLVPVREKDCLTMMADPNLVLMGIALLQMIVISFIMWDWRELIRKIDINK